MKETALLRYVALDPGKMTGVATWDQVNGFQAQELEVAEVYSFLATNFARAHDETNDELLPLQLISESFIITVNTAKNTQAHWSLELIGLMKYKIWEYGAPPLVLQTPQVGKTFGTDAKLKHVGWYTRGKGHANDAARHLMTFAATRGLIFPTATLMELAEV